MSDAFYTKGIGGGVQELLGKLRAKDTASFSGVLSSGEDSDFSAELGGALDSLSKLDNTEKLREDAIRNAKAIIKNWQPPTDSQIDQILLKMKKELLA